jgi:hypothetical protein
MGHLGSFREANHQHQDHAADGDDPTGNPANDLDHFSFNGSVVTMRSTATVIEIAISTNP